MENSNEELNNDLWTPEYEALIKDIKKRREEIVKNRKKNNPFSFPIATKVSAKTLAMDLVSVKPLSMPTINLVYTDFESEEAKLARIKREKFEKRQRVIDSLLGKTPDTKEEDKSIHVTISDNTNSQTYQLLSKWASLIESTTKDKEKQNWLNEYCKIHSSSGLI